MGFWGWLFFWTMWFDGDKKMTPMGCLSVIGVILFIIGAVYFDSFLKSFGIADGLGNVVYAYLFISWWDVLMESPPDATKGLKLIMFLSSMVALIYLAGKYLFDYEERKYGKLRAVILYFFISPHLIMLMARMIYLFFV